MSRKTLILFLGLVLLAGVYVYYISDWFAPSEIQIIHTIRPNALAGRRVARRDTPRPSSHIVSFSLNRRVRLTEVRVVFASDAATNKYPHPLWHLVSDSNSVPTKAIVYGRPIRGMRPAVKNAWPDPLQPDTAYKLYLKTDAGPAEHDFKTPPGFPAPQ